MRIKQLAIRTLFSTVVLFVGFISSCKDESVTIESEEEEITPVELQLESVLSGLDRPWGFDFLDLRTMVISDRDLGIYLYQNNEGLSEEDKFEKISGVPEAATNGQGGYFDVVKHPNYENNKLIYFSLSYGKDDKVSTALFRAKLDVLPVLVDLELLFQATPMNNSGLHFGSRIVFDGNGHVFLSLGERGSMQTAQQTSNHNGCVIRLNEDGSVPTDNPLYNANAQKPEIWTYGHRNVQGMAIHPVKGEIWTHEHGPKGGDEINILDKGANYGWPLATFGIDYNGTIISEDTFVDGTVLPIYYWVPSIAPCGMNFYYSDSIPQWKGDLFLGALAGKHLNHLKLDGHRVIEEERLGEGKGRVRYVKQGPDGYLYFAKEQPGVIMRYRPLRN